MSEVSIESAAPSFPSVVGYEILAEQRRDRLGVVYRARQVLHSREISLRLVDEGIAGRDLTHVCKSARKAALAVHRHLLSPLEVGENDGQLYLVSELPAGKSLRQRLAEGPLAPPEAAHLIADIARSVYHLHEHHALHLGLTSSGIFLASDGSPRVGDVGLSELLHDHPGSAFPGDPAYAAPEQLAMKKADGRADIYALGCLLQECLMGTPAIPVSGRPPAIERICRKAMASRPDRRYGSAADLALDLERCRSGEAQHSGTVSLFASWSRRYAAALLLAVILLLASSVGMLVLFTSNQIRLRAEIEHLRMQAERSSLEGREIRDEMNLAARRDEQRVRMTQEQVLKADGERDRERQRAHDEEKQRRSSEAFAKEQIALRQSAQDKARDADAARDTAVAARAEAARQVARLHVANGTAVMEAGDLAGALIPFIRALAVARAEKFPEDAHRLRIAALLSRSPRPLCVLSYKRGEVQNVELSPDGQRFLLVGADGVVVVRSANKGKLVGKRLVHGAAVALAAFSPDSKRIVTADAMGRVRMWNIEEGTLAFDALELEAVPLHLRFSGDGKRFVMVLPGEMGETAPEVQVYDAIKGDAIGEEISERIAALPASLSWDGSRLLVCCTDRTAKVYDVQTGKQIGPALEHPQEVVQATFSANGKNIVTICADGSLRAWNSDSGKQIGATLEHKHTALSAKMDETGRFVLLAGTDGTLRVHDLATGNQVGKALRPNGRPLQAVLSGDGRIVQISGKDGSLTTHAVLSGETVLPPLLHGASFRHVALAPDGSRSLTFDGRTIRVWDVTCGEPLGPAGLVVEPGAAYSKDGSRSARIRGDSVEIIDLPSGKRVGEPIKHKGEVKKVSFSPSGNLLLSVSNPPDTNIATPTWDVRVWQAATGKPLGDVMEHLREVDMARFVDEKRVLTISKDKQVRLWDAKTSKQIGQPRDHPEDVLLAEMTPDGKRIVTTDKENMSRIWDAETGDRIGEGMGNATPVHCLAFSRDSKSGATCCEDGTVRVWDLANGRQICQVEHTDAVLHAAFHPDGKLLLTASSDGTARAWVVATGKPHTPPLMHGQPVGRVAFSEDGRWLLSAAGAWIRIWDAENGEPIGPPIRHSWSSAAITGMSFSRMGDLLTESGPLTRWTRKLMGDNRSDNDLKELALVLSSREEAGPGQLSPASGADVESAWDHVAARSSEEFDPPRSRVLAWARRGAAECEANELWAGEVRHLDVLLSESSSADLLARRARARAGMRQFAAALADYTKALTSSPKQSDWWAGRAESHAGLGQWEQAVADLTRATQLEGRSAEQWQRLGHAEAQRGQWQKAAAALANAVRYGGDDPQVWYEHALAQLSAGDVKGYRRTCARMVKKFGDREEPNIRRLLLDACILGSAALSEFKPLIQIAQRVAQEYPTNVGDRVRLGAVLLRGGNAAKAAEVLTTAVSAGNDEAGLAWLLALAHHKAGQKEAAKTWKDKAQKMRMTKTDSWQVRQTRDLWGREAEAVGR